MTTVIKWLPVVALVLNAVGAAIYPAASAYWAAHPAGAGVVASILAGVLYFLPAPHK